MKIKICNSGYLQIEPHAYYRNIANHKDPGWVWISGVHIRKKQYVSLAFVRVKHF